jgi:hypothetical protein
LLVDQPTTTLVAPSTSLIIPVYNGGDLFRLCLESIKQLEPPPDELIVLRYSRGAYTFHSSRARRDAAVLKVEPARFYMDLLRYPFGRVATRRAAVLMALLFVSQAANAIGFFVERTRQRQT